MIVLQSVRASAGVLMLLLGGTSFAFCCDGGEPPQMPVPAGYNAPPGRVDNSDTGSCGPAVPGNCQCRRCSPDSQRYGGFFGWFRGRWDSECVAESNATCSDCNVNPEPPFGASYYATMQAQVAKGEAALMVLHHFDFVPCQGELNERGRLQLLKIARRALQNPFPIIIEASEHDPALNAARYAAVISELAPLPVAAERVVIGPSLARPMDGLDAQLIHQNLLRLMEDGSAQLSSPTGGAGAASAR